MKNIIDQNVCIFCQKTTVIKKCVKKNLKKLKKEREEKKIFDKNVD